MQTRARPDWAYEFPDRTGPDTQICRTGPAGYPNLIFKNMDNGCVHLDNTDYKLAYNSHKC